MDDPWADTAGDIAAHPVANTPLPASPRVSADSDAGANSRPVSGFVSDSLRVATGAGLPGDDGFDESLEDAWGGGSEPGRATAGGAAAGSGGAGDALQRIASADSAFASSGPSSPRVERRLSPGPGDGARELEERGEDEEEQPSQRAAAEDEPLEAVEENEPPLAPAPDAGFDDFADPAGVEDEAGGDFDDFDDFDDAPVATFDDEGFGDFGDFAEGEEGGDVSAVEPTPAPPAEPVHLVERFAALSLRPVPAHRELQERLEAVLAPLVPSGEGFNDKPPRAVGGLAQVLTSESSREAYAQLTTAPLLKPLDWTRSRVRREHLIAMGVPVNLDEVDSHRLTALPPLQIRTGITHAQPQAQAQSARNSADTRRHTTLTAGGGGGASASAPISAVPRSARPSTTDKYGLGTRPEFDVPAAERLCGLEDDQLALMPLERLTRIQDELVATTADASAQLAWLLQLKDALGQDSVTYNGMISELIANAAKAKQPSSGMWGGRKSRPASMSASSTPRSGSPGVF